jgi:hypothetical protein
VCDGRVDKVKWACSVHFRLDGSPATEMSFRDRTSTSNLVTHPFRHLDVSLLYNVT